MGCGTWLRVGHTVTWRWPGPLPEGSYTCAQLIERWDYCDQPPEHAMAAVFPPRLRGRLPRKGSGDECGCVAGSAFQRVRGRATTLPDPIPRPPKSGFAADVSVKCIPQTPQSLHRTASHKTFGHPPQHAVHYRRFFNRQLLVSEKDCGTHGVGKARERERLWDTCGPHS